MGKRGPQRKPTALKKLQGTFRADRAPKNEAQPTGHAEPPDFLSAEARAEWDRLAPELERIGLLTVADQAVFSVYVQAWSDYSKLTAQLNSMAIWTWQAESGYRQSVPEIALRREAWTRIKEAGSRLGLDPSSRSGLHVTAGSREPNPFAEFDDKPPNKFAELRRSRPNKFSERGKPA